MNRLASALCFYVVLSIITLGAFGGGDMGDDLSGFIAHSEAAKTPADKGAGNLYNLCQYYSIFRPITILKLVSKKDLVLS